MTNIVFRQVKDKNGNPVPDEDQVRLGMIKAGNRINNFLSNAQSKKHRLVRRLYRSLVENANNGVFEMCMMDPNLAGSDPFHILTPKQPNRYAKFVSDKDPDLIVRLTVHIDDEGHDADDDFIKMNIVVPASDDDLLDGGYIDTVVAQIEKLHQDGDPSKILTNKAEIEKYLLANIFLTRCH